MFKDKKDCIVGRAAPKDIFDLWFICQKMGIPYEKPDTMMNPMELKRELAKYLPADYQRVLGELL